MVRIDCQTRYDRHPRRQCNVYSPSLQLDNGGGSRHTCSLLDCFGKQSHMLSTGLLWEAVTHVLYWIALGSDSRTTHAILLTVVSGVSRIDLRVSLFARTLSERGLEDHWNSSRVYFHIFPFNYSKMGIGHMGTRPNTRLQNQWACNKK